MSPAPRGPGSHPEDAGPVVSGAGAFDLVGDAYAAGRPGYPEGLVDTMLHRSRPVPGEHVVDLGAGTGRLTAQLHARGLHVIALEPLPRLRNQLRRQLPTVPVVGGVAERLPLRGGSVGLIACGQAFHWFDAQLALAEARRVLRPGGWLALLFNIRDLTQPLQAELDELLRPLYGDTPSWGSRDWDAALATARGFAAPEESVEPHEHRLDAAGFSARIASISFVASLSDDQRSAVLSDGRSLFDRHAVDGRVAMRYRAELSLLRRLDG